MFAGFLLVAMGIFLLASQLLHRGFFSIFGMYWPLILIGYGLYRYVSHKKSRSLSILMVVAGLLFFSKSIGLIQGSILLIVLALAMIFFGIRFLVTGSSNKGPRITANAGSSYGATTTSFEDRDMINDEYLLTNASRVYHSDSFSGGSVDVMLSSVVLDLRNVSPLEPEIHMDCDVVLGRLTIEVPADWHVIVNGKHYYSQGEMEKTTVPTATLLVESDVVGGSLKIL